jgi:Arc/MetJ family transcription regulator
VKTLIDVDEDQLTAAQQVLQTTTKKDTVNRALAEVVAIAARRRDLARLRSEDASDLGHVEIMTSAWRR